MIVQVNFNYWDFWYGDSRTRLLEFFSEQEVEHPLTLEVPKDDPEVEKIQKKFLEQTFTFNILDLARHGLKFSTVDSPKYEPHQFQIGLVETLNRIEKKLGATPGSVGSKEVHLHLPKSDDSVLMQVNDVKVLDDCCTDNLREYLKDGWHIMAVCPQPKQRRPDYVLGRVTKGTVSETEVDSQ